MSLSLISVLPMTHLMMMKAVDAVKGSVVNVLELYCSSAALRC